MKHTFNANIAEAEKVKLDTFLKSIDRLELVDSVFVTDYPELERAIDAIKAKKIDLIFIHLGTFALGDNILKIATSIDSDIPLIMFSSSVDNYHNGIMQTNTFCALNMNAHTMYKLGRKCSYIYGDINEDDIQNSIKNTIYAANASKGLHHKKIGLIGSRAPGFYSSNYDELLLKSKFGIEVEYIDFSKIYNLMDTVRSQDIQDKISTLEKNACFVYTVPLHELEQVIKLYIAIKQVVKERELHALSIRCWPEFKNDIGIFVCACLSMLNKENILTSCEGDVYGIVMMLLQRNISDETPFFADLVDIDKNENQGLFWHCGSASYNLRSPDAKFTMSSFYKDCAGCAMDFPIDYDGKDITVNSLITDINHEFQILDISGVGEGMADKFKGNACKVKFDSPLDQITRSIFDNGFAHHYSLIGQDISPVIKEIGFQKDIKIFSYQK